MPIIYITGVSGTGKTAVLHVLSNIGYSTYDEDEDGLSAWHNSESGRVTAPPTGENRTDEWYSAHSWRISRPKLERIARDSSGGVTWVAGSTLSDRHVWDLFDAVICLTADEATIKRRLASRRDNDWGKAPVELKHVLAWRERWAEMYRERGAIIIDSSQPLARVVELILAASPCDPAHS